MMWYVYRNKRQEIFCGYMLKAGDLVLYVGTEEQCKKYMRSGAV